MYNRQNIPKPFIRLRVMFFQKHLLFLSGAIDPEACPNANEVTGRIMHAGILPGFSCREPEVGYMEPAAPLYLNHLRRNDLDTSEMLT
jgi:hypothetical protein